MPYRDLEHDVIHYFNARGLVWPEDADTALQFALTEMAEATELLLSRKAGWKRNNQDSKRGFSKERLAEELGDVLMMVLVAGIAEGVSPVQALRDKIQRKLEEHRGGTH